MACSVMAESAPVMALPDAFVIPRDRGTNHLLIAERALHAGHDKVSHPLNMYMLILITPSFVTIRLAGLTSR